jgi:ATP-binding cassette subfamily F protein uup
LKWKEAKELETIENDITHAESEVARIEAIFASPDFYEKRGEQTVQLTEERAIAKALMERLYVRWHELEEIKTGKRE